MKVLERTHFFCDSIVHPFGVIGRMLVVRFGNLTEDQIYFFGFDDYISASAYLLGRI